MFFYFWLIFSIVFLFLELINPGLFFFFSFFVGSLAGAFASYKAASFTYQMYSFLVCSISMLFILLWLFKRNFFGIVPKYGYKTNIYALQGKKAEVIQEIKGLELGLIKVNGEIWSAKSDEICHVGSSVEIVSVVGCHCVVKLLN